MRMIRKIFLWMLLSILFQISILFYVNNYFLTPAKITIEKVADEQYKNSSLKIPKDAYEITASFDGSYLAYIKGNNLIIVNTRNSKVKKVISTMGSYIIDYYLWIPDRNRILYFDKNISKNKTEIQLRTYDVDNDLSNILTKAIYLPYGNENRSFIKHVTLSPLTNIIYINIGVKNDNDKLYQINIMGEIKQIHITEKKIIKMYELQKTDNLIYQTNDNTVHVIKDGKKDYIMNSGKYTLIGTDNDDRIYLGKLIQNKVTSIYYGYLNDPIKKWAFINLKQYLKPTDIILLPKNSRVVKIQNNDDLVDIINGQTIKGIGHIIDINKNYIIYRKGNTVHLKMY